jgi:hypothetical protein
MYKRKIRTYWHINWRIIIELKNNYIFRKMQGESSENCKTSLTYWRFKKGLDSPQ